tara:strand:+ start:12130 stop:12447 length:318 start_codon:yes stop_codon:yes gene_type:complete
MPIIKNIKSIETAVVKNTNGDGTHDKGDIIGGTGTTTEDYTIFSASCFSSSTHSATLKFKVIEGQASYTEVKLLAGDSLSGPFVELEVDALSNADTTVLIHMQQH